MTTETQAPDPAPLAVPFGMVLVPREPTEDMLSNVDEEFGGHCHSCSKWSASWDDCRRAWAAMVAAAPTVAPLTLETAAEARKDREHAEAYYRQAEKLLTANEQTLHAEVQRLTAALAAFQAPEGAQLPPLPDAGYKLFYEDDGDEDHGDEGYQEVLDEPGYTAKEMRDYASAALRAALAAHPGYPTGQKAAEPGPGIVRCPRCWELVTAPEWGQLSSGDLLDLHHKHAPDCPTEQAVAFGKAVMQRSSAPAPTDNNAMGQAGCFPAAERTNAAPQAAPADLTVAKALAALELHYGGSPAFEVIKSALTAPKEPKA